MILRRGGSLPRLGSGGLLVTARDKDIAAEFSVKQDLADRLRAAWQNGPPPPDLTSFLTDDIRTDPQLLLTLVRCDLLERRRVRELSAWSGVNLPVSIHHYEQVLGRVPPNSPLARLIIEQELGAAAEGGDDQLAATIDRLAERFADDVEAVVKELEENRTPRTELPPVEVPSKIDVKNSPAGSPTTGFQPGMAIGPYVLRKRLGRGGFGEVWRAERRQPDMTVAIKVIRPDRVDKTNLARFSAESQALALLDHPNIARIYDAGVTDNGIPYLVMEYVQGVPLDEYCDRERLTIRQRLELMARICGAVHHAHTQGIIHRDLSPDNILIAVHETDEPQPKIVDFGIAKAINKNLRLTDHTLTQDLNTLLGKPAYMAPEQAEATQSGVDTRTDIFSLGVILYEMLTGVLPISMKQLRDASIEAVLAALRGERPDPSTRFETLDDETSRNAAHHRGVSDPRDLHRLLRGRMQHLPMKAMRPERTKRFSSAAAMATDIRNYLEDKDFVEAAPEPWSDRAGRWIKRHKMPFVAAVLIAVSLVAGIITTWAMWQAERARAAAVAATNEEIHQAWEARKQLVRYFSDRCWANWDDGRHATALLYVVEALRLVEDDVFTRRASALPTIPQEAGDLSKRLRTTIGTMSEMVPKLVTTVMHDGPVTHVAFAPDGLRFVTASQDGTARLWDTSTGRPVTAPMQHDDRVLYATFCPLGEHIVTAGADGTARIWCAKNAALTVPALVHHEAVSHAAFSHDGAHVVTTSWDGTARLWDTSTGMQVTEPMLHDDRVLYATFCPLGKRLVTTSLDDSARIWNAETGALIARLSAEDRSEHGNDSAIKLVRHAAFSPNGQQVVTAHGDNTARVWDVTNGQPLLTVHHRGPVWRVAYCSGGTRFATAGMDNTAMVWDADTGDPVFEPFIKLGGSPSHIEFSPDGRWIVTASADHTARIWDATTGRGAMPALVHGGPVAVATFSANGDRIVTAGADGSARVWDVTDGSSREQRWELHGMGLVAAFTGADALAVTTDENNVVRVWNPSTGTRIVECAGHTLKVNHAAISADGSRLVTASDDGSARTWDMRAQDEKLACASLKHDDKVMHAAFNSNASRVVTACADGTVRVWDAEDGASVSVLTGHTAEAVYAAFSPDGTRVISASRDNTARVWDAQTGAQIATLTGHGKWVQHVAFSPDGKRVVTASMDGTARLWNIDTERELTPPMQNGGPVTRAAFSPDGTRIVTASVDGAARLWSVSTGRPAALAMKHDRPVTSITFSPDGNLLVTTSHDRTARIWDAATGDPVTPPLPHRNSVIHAALSEDGTTLVTLTVDGFVHDWEITPDMTEFNQLATQAEFRAGSRMVNWNPALELVKEAESGTLIGLTPQEMRDRNERIRTRK
jgi:eukaryotic-like serine/threonine-protein kinase